MYTFKFSALSNPKNLRHRHTVANVKVYRVCHQLFIKKHYNVKEYYL